MATKKCHFIISVTEAAATIIHLDNFDSKLIPKKHLWFAGKVHVNYSKKQDTTGRTVINACSRDLKTMNIWVHHLTGGLAVVQEMI